MAIETKPTEEAGADTDQVLVAVHPAAGALSPFERLADIPEEGLWLQNQRSQHTRRAYKEDVLHFMCTFGIESREDLRKTSRGAAITWVRKMEQEDEKPRTICRRLSALSSLFKHLMEQHQVTDNPTDGVKRPAVGGETVVTAAFDEAQARKLLDAPKITTLFGLRDRAILSVLLQAEPRRAEVAKMNLPAVSSLVPISPECGYCVTAPLLGVLK